LGNIEEVPDASWMKEIKFQYEGKDAMQIAKQLLSEGKSKEALAVLW
jgi:hypothetical protein